MSFPSLRSLLATALLGAALSTPAGAVGSLADISVIDRNTGRVLPVHTHQGRHYVAGQPGARYAVRVYNRSSGRVMAVMSVDGINVVSGETAGWDQNGYVLSSWQRHDVAGWRKSQSEVAAFEFTALSNSYAARTGRPDHVGVIGVALFREQPPAPPVMTPPPRPRPHGGIGSREDTAGARAERDAAGPAAAEAPAESVRKSAADSASGEGRALSRQAPQAEPKLGTGHGQREQSWVDYTEFRRAQATPNEMITIYYDSRENLIAQGVIPAPRILPAPQPFPAQPQIGFVPDPPQR